MSINLRTGLIAALIVLSAFSAQTAQAGTVFLETGQDKIAHFVSGLIIEPVISIATNSPERGLVAAVGIGISKELYDLSRQHGKFDFFDLSATAAGGLIAYAIDKYAVRSIWLKKIDVKPIGSGTGAMMTMSGSF